MALPDQTSPVQMSETAYLAFERATDGKHEYIDGQVVAMTGASRAHNLISVNLIRLLSTQLRGSECEVYPSDMRVKIPEHNYTYPDLSIVCGDTQLDADVFDTVLNPRVVIEILSNSTEAYDRGEKFRQYRQIPTLREYILVSQHSARLECYWLEDEPGWRFSDVDGIDATLELKTVTATLPLKAVYERVPFTPHDR